MQRSLCNDYLDLYKKFWLEGALGEVYEKAWPGEHRYELERFAEFANFVASEPRCLDRALERGHLTASALVTEPSRQKVLLIKHKKLKRWLQPGGHADGQPDLGIVALNEVREETGLKKVSMSDLLCDTSLSASKGPRVIPLDLDIHTIPEHKGIKEHKHYDLRFLVESLDSRLTGNFTEVSELGWFDFDEVRGLTDEKSVLRLMDKLFCLKQRIER